MATERDSDRYLIHGHVAEATAASLAAAADRAAESIAESTTWTVDAANIEPLPERSPDVLENILRAYEHIEQVSPPEPVKVTREQWDALRVVSAPAAPQPPWGSPSTLCGVPVVFVDDPAEATFPGIDVHSVDVEEQRPRRRWWRRRA